MEPSAAARVAAAALLRVQLMQTIDRAYKALDEQDFDTARSAARDCLGQRPDVLDCHHALLFSFTRKGEFTPELAQALQDCLEQAPHDPECLEVAVSVRLRAGDLVNAKRLLAERNAIPDLVPDYVDAAEIALASGDLVEACKNYGEACRLSQEFACSMVKTRCAHPPSTPSR